MASSQVDTGCKSKQTNWCCVVPAYVYDTHPSTTWPRNPCLAVPASSWCSADPGDACEAARQQQRKMRNPASSLTPVRFSSAMQRFRTTSLHGAAHGNVTVCVHAHLKSSAVRPAYRRMRLGSCGCATTCGCPSALLLVCTCWPGTAGCMPLLLACTHGIHARRLRARAAAGGTAACAFATRLMVCGCCGLVWKACCIGCWRSRCIRCIRIMGCSGRDWPCCGMALA